MYNVNSIEYLFVCNEYMSLSTPKQKAVGTGTAVLTVVEADASNGTTGVQQQLLVWAVQ